MSKADPTDITPPPAGDHSPRATGPDAALGYPAHGQMPDQPHLSACELLCWIGYGRAIPKTVYFAPAFANRMPPDQWGNLVHGAIPDPKPPADPIDDAERKLIDALRKGKLKAYQLKDGRYEEVSAEVYNYAVTINARGSIEADQNITQHHSMVADDFLYRWQPIRDVAFRTPDVLAVWPGGWPSDGVIPKPRTVEHVTPPTDQEIEKWFCQRVSGWDSRLPFPNAVADMEAFRTHFGQPIKRSAFRDMRKKATPPEWCSPGPRQSRSPDNAAGNSAKTPRQN